MIFQKYPFELGGPGTGAVRVTNDQDSRAR